LYFRNYIVPLRILKHQVDTEYELLKKALGYPSENFYDIFIRMTKKQKWLYIRPFIKISLFALVPATIMTFFEYFNLAEIWKLVVLIVSSIIYLFFLY